MHQSHKILNEQYTVTMSHTSSNWWRYNNLKVWTLKFKNLWLPLLYAHNKETSMNLSNSLGGDVTIQRYVNYSCLNMLSTTSFPVGHIRNITILFFIFLFSWWASQCYIGLWSLLTSSDWSPKVYVLYCTMLKKSCLEHVGVNMPRFVRKQVREETKIIFVFGCNFVWSR